MEKKTGKREKAIPARKLKAVENLAGALKNKRTIILFSIQNLPSALFQEIKKKLKDKVEIRVYKKNIAKKGLELGKKEAEVLKDYINENIAIGYSDLEPFELSAVISEEKSPTKAKIGQEVPEDIVIEPGPTEIPPGPAISEFGALGIKVGVEAGKIAIKERKIVLKKGEKVTSQALAIMTKLSINPFVAGLEPIAAYDREENKVYGNIKINKKKTLEELKNAFSRALAFAVAKGYESKETIGFILAKASAEEKALSILIKEEK